MPRIRRIVLPLVLLLLAGMGLWALLGADGDHPRRAVVSDGVPLVEVHPTGLAPGERRPGVVVAHGFAGSARLMAPFGDTLAARGYVVVLLDFDGHGASTRRLPDAAAATGASEAALARDLDVALAHLRSRPDVDPDRIALVGHSMGATAVTRYAAGHPDIATTVAISLPDAATVPDHLLVMPGALEFPNFHEQAALAVAGGGPDRRLVTVPGVEHVSVLYAPRTHRETADWLDTTFDRPVGEGPGWTPMRRLAGAALLVFALLIGMIPLARLLFGPATRKLPRFDVPLTGRAVLVAAVASALAAPITALLPTERLPLSLAGYLGTFAAVAGALILAYFRWRGPTTKTGPTATDDAATSSCPAAQAGPHVKWKGAVLLAYAIVTILVPTHLGLTHTVPVGPKWWMVALVSAGFALFAYAAERLTAGNSLAVLAVSAVATIALTAAAVLGLTSSFLVLAVMMIAVLFVWQAVWSAVLNRHDAPAWMIAPVGAVLVAWPLVTALPVVG